MTFIGLNERLSHVNDNLRSDYCRLWIESDSEHKSPTWDLVDKNKSLAELEIFGDAKLLVDSKLRGTWQRTRNFSDSTWRHNLKVGDIVTVLGKDNRWNDSTIVDVKEDEVFIACDSCYWNTF